MKAIEHKGRIFSNSGCCNAKLRLVALSAFPTLQYVARDKLPMDTFLSSFIPGQDQVVLNVNLYGYPSQFGGTPAIVV